MICCCCFICKCTQRYGLQCQRNRKLHTEVWYASSNATTSKAKAMICCFRCNCTVHTEVWLLASHSTAYWVIMCSFKCCFVGRYGLQHQMPRHSNSSARGWCWLYKKCQLPSNDSLVMVACTRLFDTLCRSVGWLVGCFFKVFRRLFASLPLP